MPTGGVILLSITAFLSAKFTGRSMIEFLIVGVMMAVVTGGIAYSLSKWFTEFVRPPGA